MEFKFSLYSSTGSGSRYYSAELNVWTKDITLIQFPPLADSSNSLYPDSYISIVLNDLWRGTTSDCLKYITLMAHESDTIIFSSLGFKKSIFVTPDKINNVGYFIGISGNDTIMSAQNIIQMWPMGKLVALAMKKGKYKCKLD